MEPENTLQNMALYDFKTPINVIFYDESSDEENNSQNAVVTANNVGSTDNEISITSNVKEKKNENEEREDYARNLPILPVCEKNKRNECIQKEPDSCNKSKNSNKVIRRKRKSTDLFYKDEVIKQKFNVNVPNNNLGIPQDSSVFSDSTSSNLLSPHLYQDSDNVMQDPLKSISNFLINIAESYNYHIIISNKKPTKNNKEISKKHYLEIKYNLFKTAYEIVKTYIIPKEQDRNFINKFLTYTIEIANKKTKLDSSKIIIPLFKELIKWVKQRKRNDESKVTKPNCKKQNSILIEKLSQPSILNFNITPPVNQQNCDIQWTCTFTPQSADEEITINFNTALSISQNNKTIINNDISRDENIRGQNLLPTLQLSQSLQNCNNNRPLNKCPSGNGMHNDATPLVSHDTVRPSVNEMAHNQTINKINNSTNNQNDTLTNSNISYDKNIRSQNPLPPSRLLNYLQNYNLQDCNNRRLNNVPANTDLHTISLDNHEVQHTNVMAQNQDMHTDAMPLVNHDTVRPTVKEMAYNQTVNKINNSTNNQNYTLTNSNISYDKNIQTQNPLPPSHLLHYLQNCNSGRLNNVLANTDLQTGTIPLANHDEFQHSNGMSHNQSPNNINYQERPSPRTCYAYPSLMAPRHSQTANISKNTAFHPMDPNENRFNIQINNSSPHNIHVVMDKNTKVLPNQDSGQSFHQNQLTVNYGQTNTDHLNTNPFVPFVTHSQTTSNISYPPRCCQNTVVHRMYSNQKRINDKSNEPNMIQQNTTNVMSNQDLNRQYHSVRVHRNRNDNRQVINEVRLAQPVHNAPDYLSAQNGNCHLNHLRNMTSIPQYLPSYVNRPISSSVVNQSNINLENRGLNSVQNQELTMRLPPPPIQQDRSPLTQDYVSSAIVQHNVQPEPLRSRSALSADSGIASPVTCGDGSNNMENIMNDLFELEDTTELTSQLPVITHVTSLSSKVAFVKEGSCYICGKIAKQMCSGCYKIYYCSIRCQTLDWRIHKYGCGQNAQN